MKPLSLRVLRLFGEMGKDRLDLHALFEAAGNEPAECPPLAYSGLVDQELVQELQKVWVRLEEKARGASGELKLHCR